MPLLPYLPESLAQSGVTAIAAGGYHTVALKNDGSVVAWGINFCGETTVPDAAQSGVTAIAAGWDHTVAIKTDGSVVAWGWNVFGQTTVPFAAQSGVIAIAAGGEQTVALVAPTPPTIITQPASQSVVIGDPVTFLVAASAVPPPAYQWRFDGGDIAGAAQPILQLGNVTLTQAGSYTVVVSNSLGSVTSAVATLTVNVFAPTITTQPASQTVVVGDPVTFSVEAFAAPPPTYQWQFNGVAIAGATTPMLQLGNVSRSQAGNYAVVVSNFVGSVTSAVAALTVNFVVQFSATRYSVWESGRVATIAVLHGGDGPGVVTVNYATSNRTATAGQDYVATSGTLTFGPGEMEKTFVVPILDNLVPEGAKTLGLALSGLTGAAVFGANTNAQLTIIDDEQSSASSVRARPILAVSYGHTVALKADGSLWTWGLNNEGQLGIGMEFGPGTNTPTQVGTDHDWATVAAALDHTLAVKTDGSLWAWGAGPLGVGDDADVPTNVPIRVGTDADWVMVAAGDDHTLGLKTDGSLWAWGDLNGTNRPAQMGSDFDWAWIGAGWRRSLAVKQDGRLWELTANGGTPVGTDNDWEIVVTAGGSEFWASATSDAVALKSDGSLWTWGGNNQGQLGDGTTTSRSEPAQVGMDLDWTAIAAAHHHTLAVKSDGSLWAWGENSNGELGLGVHSGPNQLDPSPIGTNNDWVAVAAGESFSIGLKSDGSLWAWGNNGWGQLGLGDDLLGQVINVPTRIGTDNDWAQPSALPVRGEFRITAQSLNVDHSRTLFFTHTNARAYYILYRGDSLTNITQPVDATLARTRSSLTDRTLPVASTVFYRIRAVPRTQPLDLDGDGIDDYYELRHAAFLHPLNPADAAQDYDGDGYSNLSEYRAGTDPARLSVRHSIASGLAHTVVLKQDGSLWAWGYNTYGQLGDGTYDFRSEPVRIGTDTNWISVSAGRDSQQGDYTVALKRDGSLWAWGANHWGQLGYPLDQIPNTNVPVRVGNSSAWTDVSAGGGYTAALQRDGSLWMWGNNNWNILPCCVGTDTDWVSLSAGGAHILALKSDRSLWAWGDNSWGQCGLGEGVSVGANPTRVGTDNDWIAIAASGDVDPFNGTHSLGLKADGTLWSWGQDTAGELGLGNSSFNQFTPARVGTDTDWAAIAVGVGTSLARKRDGSLWAWGTGFGTEPRLASERHHWQDFAAGGAIEIFPNFANAIAIAADGSLWTWNFGVHVSRVPVQVGAETNWATITAGDFHSLALKLDGSLWSWGANGGGQLGDGTFDSRFTPSRIASIATWRTISAGWFHTVAMRDDSTLWAWGYNFFGQLGIGTFNTNGLSGINTPQPVATNAAWGTVAAGGHHTVALRADGSLWTWGAGLYGELGNGMFTTNVPSGIASPFAVEPAANWSALAAGFFHTIGLRSDGSLWACGDNGSGELGLGFFTTNAPYGISTLQRVPTNVVWSSITAGGVRTFALSADGKLWAWGGNYSGELGNGSFVSASLPQSIAPDKAWKAVVAGSAHTVALDSDGKLWIWGDNYYGQLGIGALGGSRNTPQLIQPNTTWKAISAGGSHTLAIREDGTLWSWGDNSSGQLGIPPDLAPTRLGPATDWGSPP